MNRFSAGALLITVTAVSVLLTDMVRRYGLAYRVLDVPNYRSSHTVPTPRGGGVAIVATFLAGMGILFAVGVIDSGLAMALAGASLVVALIGAIDDHRHLRARWRLLAHFSAAGWALVWLGGFPPVGLSGAAINLGWTGHILAAFLLVWLINLYNFMDGIDGIAGVEAVSVGLGAAAVNGLTTPQHEWLLPALLALASLGFLVRNWPPAMIFMGDAGSGFLGAAIGVLAIHDARGRPEFLWIWIILLGIFVVDATMTLLRRLARGERVYEPHQRHAYQYAARWAGAHKPVTLAVAAINVLWLLPIAIAVGLGRLNGLAGTLIAYAPLVWLAIQYHAGAAPANPAMSPGQCDGAPPSVRA